MTKLSLSQGQITYLDFVRGMAAMVVLFGHSAMMFLGGSTLDKLHIQEYGVILFFVISGFLISRSVFQKIDRHDYTFRHFFCDRFFRIYCGYIPALIFVAIVDYFLKQKIGVGHPNITPERYDYLLSVKYVMETTNIQTWFGNLFMLQYFPGFQILNLIGIPENEWFIKSYGSATPFWTISIEWWLYMSFGFGMFFIFKNAHPKLWHYIIFGILSFVPFYYAIGGIMNCLSVMWFLGVFASVLFYFYSGNESNTGRNYKKYALYLALIFFACTAGRLLSLKIDFDSVRPDEAQLSIFITGLIFSLFLYCGHINKVNASFKKIVTFIADYSFSLYLTHRTVVTAQYVFFPGHDNDMNFFLISIVISNIIAIIFWYLFERHHKAISNFVKKRISKPQTAQERL